MAQAEEIEIRKYLLGQLTEADEEQVELRLLTDQGFAEEYDIVVNEMTDDYVAGKFEGEEIKRVEEHFFRSAQRRDKLKFALALNAPAVKKLKTDMDAKRDKQRRFRRYLAMAASLVLLAGGSFYVWRVSSRDAELNKGLAALQSAFREERPLEARISKFDYAPYITTRGIEPEKIDQDELRRAELTLLDAAKKNPTPGVHHGLGKVYLAKKDFDKAIKEFEEAFKGDPKNAQLYSDLGAAWLEKGRIDRGKDPGKGMEELGRSLENLNKALELDSNLLEARFNRALCRQHLMLSQQAAEDWREYLNRDSNSLWAEEARRNLQRIEDKRNKTSHSKEQLLEQFLAAFKDRNDDAAWAALSRSRGRAGNQIVEALINNYLSLSADDRVNEADLALQHLSYAGKLERGKVTDFYTSDIARFYSSTTSSDRAVLLRARDLMRQANERYNRTQFGPAAEMFSLAKTSFASVGNDSEVLFAESWIGYSKLRSLDASVGQQFEQLAKTFEQRHYISLAAQAMQALADAKSSLNELSKTVDLTKRALALSQRVEDDATTVRCLTRLLISSLLFGDYSQSLEFFASATTLADSLPYDPKLLWPIYYETGLSLHFLAATTAALAFEEEAMRLANDADVALLRSRSWERLGILLGEQKRHDEAIQNGERAIAEASNVPDERTRTNALAHSMLRTGRIYSDAGKAAQSLDYFNESIDLYQKLDSKLYLYEGHKGKLIADIQLNDDEAADAELPIVIALFEQHREKITEESNRDKFFDNGQDTYDIAIDFAFKKKRNEQALAYAEQSRARSLFEMMRAGMTITNNSGAPEIQLGAESKPRTPAEIQGLLSEKTQLLQYSVVDDKVLMWVVKRSGIEGGLSEIKATDLEQATRNFVEALERPEGKANENIKQQAKALYALLITPIEKYLDRSLLLVVIPDKNLNYLPFEALVSEATGRFLIEDYTLQRAPSATIFIELTGLAKKLEYLPNERLLSVGNPRFSRDEFSTLPDLPSAAREAEQIAGFYEPELHLLGDAATANRVKHELSSSQVVHLATHAVADERSPLLSKLLMTANTQPSNGGTNGVLTAAEIYQTKLPRTRLVVLSACRTGIERAYRGEGAIGLARPFMVAGVPIVIASLWPVESEAAAVLMISFHKHRKLDPDHVSTVEALRRAQLDMIYNPQPHSDFGWAAFGAIGGYAAF